MSLAHEAVHDPRLLPQRDAACFICGKRANGPIFLEAEGYLKLAMHPECANGLEILQLSILYHRAVTGIVTGGPSKRIGVFRP